MEVKARLHELVDQIPEHQLAVAEHLLTELSAHGADPKVRQLLAADTDDEPLSEAELHGLRESREDFAAGRVRTNEEMRREFGW